MNSKQKHVDSINDIKVNKNMLILLMNSKEKHVDSINDIKVNKNMLILSMT